MDTPFRTWAEIDLDALRGNWDEIRAGAGKTALFAVVKADAYGHGAVTVARALSDTADGFAVATFDEAVELRLSGVTGRILILNTVNEAWFGELIGQHIAMTVFSVEVARKLNEAAEKAGEKAEIFLAVDTGMTRIGLSCDEDGLSEAAHICSFPFLTPVGIFTHPACADEPETRFSEKQLAVFAPFLRVLEENGIVFPFRCFCNSAALAHRGAWGNLCKVGLLLYGVYPSEKVRKSIPVTPVLSWRARILSVRTVRPGTGIGYNHTFVASKTMRIATVAAGYADGVPLSLSNCGSVIVNGQFAPIVGRVCMDQMMVDVTGIENVAEGDTATLIGRDGSMEITVRDIAETVGSIPYEILCSIGPRVTRVYLRDGNIAECRSALNPKIQ